MQKLPLSRDNYNRSLLIADFISKIKTVLEAMPEATDILFSPEAKGYTVSFRYNESSCTLRLNTLRRPFGKHRLKLRIYKEGILQETFSVSDTQRGAERLKKFLSK